MTNIQSHVTNFIEQDVSIRRGLTRGIINTRALALYINKNIAMPCTLDAVISAIRRYEGKEEIKEDVKRRYKLIASAKVSSRTRMASVLLNRDFESRKSLMKLYEKIDFSKGEVIRILEVSQNIKIIIDETNLAKLEGIFPKKDIVSSEKRLGEIDIIYTEDIKGSPGIFSALSSELAMEGISIKDGVISGNEHIFIVNENDLMKSLEAMHRIAKWGDRAK